MDYSIRDVSEILNLSREMIRYYEKYGVISPRRNDENNYRSYSTFDIFMLLDTLQYRSWGIQIKGMQDLRQEDFLQKSRQHLCLYRERLKEEVHSSSLTSFLGICFTPTGILLHIPLFVRFC